MRTGIRGVVVFLGVLLACGASSRASMITVSTDQAGANTQIDRDHSATFDFTVLSGQSVTKVTGDFTLKRGSQTESSITLSLYRVGGPLLKSASLSAESISTSYTSELFALNSLNLGAGNYSLTLTSSTGTGGSRQYFFKGGNLLVTPSSVAVPTVPAPALSVGVPEPTNLLTASLACVATLAVCRKRRN